MQINGFCRSVFAGLLFTVSPSALSASEKVATDGSTQAPRVILQPGPEYADQVRRFQGIPAQSGIFVLASCLATRR